MKTYRATAIAKDEERPYPENTPSNEFNRRQRHPHGHLICRPALLATASTLALAAMMLTYQPAVAGTYTAATEQQLRDAITAANLESGPSTITLEGDIAMASNTNFPTATRPITIDMNGHTISGRDAPSGSPVGNQTGGAIVFVGPVTFINSTAITGGDADPTSNANGGRGLVLSSADSSLTNTGTITGGAGAGSGNGDVGAQLGAGTYVNNGTIRGGAGGAAGSGGTGVNLAGGSLTNHGLIEGGAGNTASAGMGINLSGTGTSTITNNGTIRGGTSSVPSTGNGHNAIFAASGTHTIINNGTIEGGTGGPAIFGNFNPFAGTFPNFTIINDGTISAGAGQADAIRLAGTSGTNVLELHSNSVINGNVVATVGTGDTLRLADTGTNQIDMSQYLNFDTFEKTDTGTWTLTGDGSAFGSATVQAGTLAVNGTLGGTMDVLTAGRLQGTGEVGTTTNAGTIAPGNSIGTLFVNGDYTGTGGSLEAEAVLSGTGSPADRLVISGNASGTTTVNVVNVGGTGAVTGTTSTDGISIVQVGGTSTASAFQLNGGYAAAGPYRYQLVSFDPGASAASEADPLIAAPFWDYRLQSVVDESGNPVPVPQVPAYQGVQTGALRYVGELMDSLHKRYDSTPRGRNQQVASTDPSIGAAQDADSYWFLRSKGLRGDVSGDEGPDYDQNIFFVQGGGTIGAWDVGDRARALRTGVALSYGGSKVKVKDTGAKVELEGPSLAATATYEGEPWYIDAVVQGTHLTTSVDTVERGFVGSPDGWGVGASVQGGYPLELGNNLVIEPQAQLSYQRIWFDTFTDEDGIEVDLNGGESLRGRLGTRVQTSVQDEIGGKPVVWTPFVEASAVHEFLDGSGITAGGVTFATDNGGTSALFAGGLEADLAGDTTLFAEVSREQGLTDGAADVWSGTLGLRVNW